MERHLNEADLIVSKTDLSGRITYGNKIFLELAEYEEEELIGHPHNILRHPDMPKAIFHLLWERIQKKEEIFAYVVNRTKNWNHYWVYANVTASLDEQGQVIGFYSVRRSPNPKALESIKRLYQRMVDAERRGGISAGSAVLNDFLKEEGIEYDEYIIGIQE